MSHQNNFDHKRIFGLDFLRASAITLVVICHVILIFPLRLIVGEINANLMGYLGVEIFFVLSGFLIGQILLRDFERSASVKTLGRFLLRRWFRTLPNYFLFLAFSYFVVGYLSQERGFAWKYLFFLQNFYLPMKPFFFASWSLAVEEWFYILFPCFSLLILSLFKSFKRSIIISIVLFILISMFARLYYVLETNPSWDDGVRKILIYRLDAIIIGVGAAAVKRYFLDSWFTWRLRSLAFGLALFGACLWSYYNIDLNASIFNRVFLFSLVSFSVALWLPFFDNWKNQKGIVAKGITFLSLWSYSLYLCHSVFVDHLSQKLPSFAHLDRTTLTLVIAGFIAISVVISGLVYTYFEKPMTALRDRFS